MQREKEIYRERLKKYERLEKWIGAYPESTASPRMLIGNIVANFEALVKTERPVRICGRIHGLRTHGGAAFVDLEDISGKIQLFLSKDHLKGAYDIFAANADLGDIMAAAGAVFMTKRGERTILVQKFTILAKTLRPIPQEFYGLRDVEERFRKRYLDFLVNKDERKTVFFKAMLLSAIRKFLMRNGFLEVETPILQPIAGGAAARPFKTHHNALDAYLYLRIAPELYLKRLLVGGFERVYELGRCFRNEGIDQTHNPEFTMLEFYWAYQDYRGLMRFTEKMFRFFVREALGGTDQILFEEKRIGLGPPWNTVEFEKLLRNLGLNFASPREKILEVLHRNNLILADPKHMKQPELLDAAVKKLAFPKFIQPTFVTHHPVALSPLAKALQLDPKKVARFQLVIGGMEIVNAYSELNDPVEQKKRFEKQEKARKAGSEEAQRYDADFIEALEYGMPPAAGFGMGIDRLVMLLSGAKSLREVILFPTMRPRSPAAKRRE